jgi:general secretion pathway protein N
MKRPVLIFAAMLVAALLLLLPLRLVLMAGGMADSGLAAQSVSGSLWSGQMHGAVWRGINIGDGEAKLSPLALLGGGIRLGWTGENVAATLLRQGNGGGIEAATGQIGPVTIGGMVLQRVDFDGFEVVFDGARCDRSGGRLTVQPGGVLMAAGAMAGAPRCDGDAVVLPLVSADQATQMTLRVRSDATFRAVISIEPVAETLRPALQAAGFQPSPQGMTMTVEGVL